MTRKQTLLVAGAVVLAFLIGFGWQYLRASSLSDELEETRRALVLERLETSLAAAAIEAQRGSYEAARQFVSEFYTGLQENIGAAPEAARPELERLLAQRDALVTALSRGDPATADLLPRLLVRYRTALEGLDAALPVAQPGVSPPAPVDSPR